MNRGLLIVICDFLLLSLLSLARFDGPEPQTPKPQKPEAPAATDADLSEALKLALEDERKAREALNAELANREQSIRIKDAEKRLLEAEAGKLNQQLTNTQVQLASLTTESTRIRERLDQTTTTLASREALLAEREQRIRDTQAVLQRREAEAKSLENERVKLREQLATSSATMTGLQQQLTATDSEAKAAQEQLAKTQREAAELQSKLSKLESNLTATELEKQIISGQLGVAQTEARMARDQVNDLRTEKERLHEQTTKLSEGLETLAKQSVELTEEMRIARPLPANAIFADAATNRVMTHFQVGKKALLGGEATRQKETRSVLVQQGGQVCALYHIQDTPLSIDSPNDWEWFVATLLRGSNVLPLQQIGFSNLDPRVVLVPLSPDQVKQSGAQPYKIVDDPAKFPDAVLVGAQGGYYGECRFQIDLAAKDYVRMERKMFSKLVGDFVPSSGDLVFSKTGDLLGVMVNKDYCLLLSSLRMSHTLATGTTVTDQRIRNTLASVNLRMSMVPERVR